jgi:hypothetical protein
MGILDDAIREHLELKRSHGVPEDELQRQEEEALGPARRGVAQQHEEAEPTPGQTATAEVDGAAPPEDSEETALFDMEQATAPEAAPQDETALHEPAAAEPTPVEPHAPEEAAPEEIAADEAPHAEAPHAEEPQVLEPEPQVLETEPHVPETEPQVLETEPHPLPPEADEEPVGEPGHEPDPREASEETEPHGFEAIEDEHDHAEEDELDVLEDTPDFLQETPEHDRLWFEQKPPRDFDFD